MTFVANEAGLTFLFTDTQNGIARFLEATGETVAIATQENIGSQWPRGAVNPAPGPPFRRSGDMQASIRSTPAKVVANRMVVDVIVDAAHRGFNYPEWLLYQAYEFVNLQSFHG